MELSLPFPPLMLKLPNYTQGKGEKMPSFLFKETTLLCLTRIKKDIPECSPLFSPADWHFLSRSEYSFEVSLSVKQ